MAENQNIEYKESWRDEYLKWLSGYANACGGTLFIGYHGRYYYRSGSVLREIAGKELE